MTASQSYEFVDIPKAKLNNGASIPLLGLGTWKASPDEVGSVVEQALRMGYRHIDEAAMYGNQDGVGRTFTKLFKEGKIKREDIWVTSKLHNKDHAADQVRPAIEKVLKELQLEQLDLFLMHWPVTGNKGNTVEPPIKETWQAMEKLVDEGLTRSIGISNFSVKKIKDLLSYARIPPAVNQIEVHPYFRNQYNIDFCHSKGIHVTAYSPLGTPDSASIMKRANDTPSLLQEEAVKKVADKLGKAPAQVLVRWGIQHGTSVIPKASSESHLRSNLDVLNWELSKDDFHAISSIKIQARARMVDGSMWLQSEGPYRTLDDLWDGELGEEVTKEE
ncbi:Aldo-keto reductase family 4 member C10 [Coccomyxa sp. Obi]|nr:Aldo-keto reductase family 4 member C10 [Coccomyxa sp. Obi]